MTKLHKRIATAAASGAMLLQAAMPVFALDLTISGNVEGSENVIDIQTVDTTTVVQNNVTDVNNDINVKADTGDNKAEDNAGGDVAIDTGNADVVVAIENVANSNVAEVEACGTCNADGEIKISGNGEGTKNLVELDQVDAVSLFQDNVADFDNDVKVDANTGDNKAEDNTGTDAEYTIETGNANVAISAINQANQNVASVGRSGGDAGSLSLMITDNVHDSLNVIDLGLANAMLLSQANTTEIDNDFDVEAETGDNEIEDSAGALVHIDTGNAMVTAGVANAAGYNFLHAEGCCNDAITAKIAGNGEETHNAITADLLSSFDAFQENSCGESMYHMPSILGMRKPGQHHDDSCFDNDLDLEAYTGDNNADDNAGSDDPMIETGDAEVVVGVSNEGAENYLGAGSSSDSHMPGDSDSGMHFSFSFDFWGLFAGMGN